MGELTLRKLSDTDADWVYALTSQPEVARYMRFDTHTDPAQAHALIAEATCEGNYGYAVCGGDGRGIGVLALKRGEREGVYSISAFSRPDCWNRGFFTGLIRRLCGMAAQTGARELTAYVVEENLGSRRVLEKNGFAVKERLVFDDLPSGLLVYRRILPETGATALERPAQSEAAR